MSEQQAIEAEVVPTQAVAVRPQTGLPTVADLEQQFALAVRQRELLSDYIKKQLVPGKHFYQRGDQKPSLTKEGAEIILLPHNLAPDYQIISGPDKPPEDGRPYQITVKCTLRRKGDPNSFVGSGIGSAGSEHRSKDGKYTPRQPDKYLCHNATLKMAEKSAMIAATLNSTAGSEFFSQDMEPEAGNAPGRAEKPTPPSSATPPKQTQPAVTAAPRPRIPADVKSCLAKFIENIETGKLREKATQFLIDLAWLIPTESIEHLPDRFVPRTKEHYISFLAKLTSWSVSGKPEKPYEPHWDTDPKSPGTPKTPTDAPTKSGSGESETTKPIEVPRETSEEPSDEYEVSDEPWYEVIVPVPHKGEKRDEYLKHPDTIGSLYAARHQDEEARKRLWGFLNHFEPKGWVKRDGTVMPPSESDIKFREALDQFGDWFEKNHPDEKL